MLEPRAADRRDWVAPLLAMFATQFFAAYPLRIVPLLGATIAAHLAIAPSAVGYFASLASIGTLVGILLAPLLVRSVGVLRTLQGCLLVSAAAACAFLLPTVVAVCFASLLVGLADGPAGFAASGELHRAAPARSRRLLFAISSMGGAFGSLTSTIAVAFVVSVADWRTAVVVSALVTALAIWPLRMLAWRAHAPTTSGVERTGFGYGQAVDLMRRDRTVSRLLLGATILAMSQGAWLTFFVAYLVESLDEPLGHAAALLAVTQALALGSRLLFSRFADLLGSARPAFVLICVLANLSWLGLASLERTDDATILYIVVAVSGLSIAAWNGLIGSELASRVPDSMLIAVNSVTALSMTIGYAASVAGLAWLAQRLEGFGIPFVIVAVVLAFNAFNFLLMPRTPSNFDRRPPDAATTP